MIRLLILQLILIAPISFAQSSDKKLQTVEDLLDRLEEKLLERERDRLFGGET